MNRRHIAILFAALLATAGSIVIGVIVLEKAIDPFDDEAFSAQVWATAGPESRAAMAEDAIRCVPAGTTEMQVVGLLGKPEEIVLPNRGAGGNRVRGTRAYTYFLGNWSMHGMDSAFVFVHFDASDRVILAEIYGY